MGGAQSNDRYSTLDSSEASPAKNKLFFCLIHRALKYIWRKLSHFIPFLSTSEEAQLEPILPIRTRPPNTLTNDPSLHKNVITSQPRTNSNHPSLQGYPYPKSHDLNNVVYSTKQPDRVPPSFHEVTRSFSSASVNQETKKSFVFIQGIGSGKFSCTSVRVEETKRLSAFNSGNDTIPHTSARENAKKAPILTQGINSAKTSYTGVKEEENKKSSIFNPRNYTIPYIGTREEVKKAPVLTQGITSAKISFTSVREEENKKSSIFNPRNDKIPYIGTREEVKKASVLTQGINSGKTSYTGVREEENKKSSIFNPRKDKIPYIGTREEVKKAPVLTQGITSAKISFTSVRVEAKKSSLFTQEHSYGKILPICGDKAKVFKKEVVIKAVDEARWIKHYSSRHRILLVGEGDFSFSACLATAFGCASRMIATSLDSKEFLIKNYKLALPNLKILRNRNCMVLHGIDATEMAQNDLLKHITFDRIIYNFPFAGFFKELPRNIQIKLHKELVMKFLKNAKEMVSENGEIHISHKTNDFHVDWNLECIAYEQGLRLIEAIKFSLSDYPG